LLLDSGAEFSCIDSLYFKKSTINLNYKEKILISGVGNSTKLLELYKDTLEIRIGNNNVSLNNFVILDLKKIIGKQIDGILGVDFLKKNIYNINYLNNTIKNKLPTKEFKKLFLNNIENFICLPLEIQLDNKIIKGNFVIDFGSSVTTLNYLNYLKINSIKNISKVEYISNGGVGEENKGISFFADKVKINDFEINQINLEASKDTLGVLSKTEYDGIIGNDILDKFELFIDYTNSTLYIKPNINLNKKNKNLYKSFLLVDRTDISCYWIVSKVFKNSNAYLNGLRLNDKIISINGKFVYKMKFNKFFKNLKPNDKINLEILRKGQFINISIIMQPFIKYEIDMIYHTQTPMSFTHNVA
jgi:hypothetical protein